MLHKCYIVSTLLPQLMDYAIWYSDFKNALLPEEGIDSLILSIFHAVSLCYLRLVDGIIDASLSIAFKNSTLLLHQRSLLVMGFRNSSPSYGALFSTSKTSAA